MAHEIKVKLRKKIEVLNSDVEIVVKKDCSVLGTLTLSKGSIDWRPKKKHIGGKNEVQLSWVQFDMRMREAN
jgi:putative transposon-encoded protein